MADDGVWATDAEILATASLLKTDVVVYSRYGENFRCLRYPASFKLDKRSAEAVYLANLNEHFNVVISVE